MGQKSTILENKFRKADSQSKQVIFLESLNFFNKPSKLINKKDLKFAKNVLLEIENWELENSEKGFSMLKNNSILVAYLAYRFGELIGLTQKELSNVYLSGLVHEIGKVHMCGENKALAYKYLDSPLKKGQEGFEKIEKALKIYPQKTKEYLEKTNYFDKEIINTSFRFHSVYSNIFKEKKLTEQEPISQVDTVLWFANSLSAISFSSLEGLQRNYSKDRYISMFEGLELLRKQTSDRSPEFWDKASGAALMGLLLTMVVSFSQPPSKAFAANYDSDEVLSILNDYRLSEGLEPLSQNEKLTQAAMEKARDMLEKDYWAHESPSGEKPWKFIKENDYKFAAAGENLARGFKDPYKMRNALLESPSHKENIIDPVFEDIGIAVVDGTMDGKEVTLVVQLFAKHNAQENVEIVENENNNSKMLHTFKNLLEKILNYIKD